VRKEFEVKGTINFLITSVIRERPFNLKGGEGYGFFLKKNILIPNDAEKNILILVEEKKNNLIQSFLSCNIMLNSGKKIRALRDKKKF
jgi:hypothetical protein